MKRTILATISRWVGSIPIVQIAHSVEVWGYTNKACLRRLNSVRAGASNKSKSPTDWKSGATQTKPASAGSIQSAKADFVCVAAISNRQVFLLRLSSCNFQSPGIFAKMGCTRWVKINTTWKGRVLNIRNWFLSGIIPKPAPTKLSCFFTSICLALYFTFCLATPVLAANPAQVQQLLDTKNCPGCDLVGADLSGKNLWGANLVDANLRGAILFQANLERANLVGADLTGADVTDTTLRQANLLEAKLSTVNLNKADIHNAKFSPNTLLKDNLQNLQLLQLLVTVLGTIVATIFLIPQYLENQKWRIYEFIAREVKEFETRQETINVMRMLASDDRNIKLFPDADNSKNKFVLVKKQGLCEALASLDDQDLDEDVQKPRKADQAYINAAIRDNFDKVLDNLERFNNLIESKVVTKEGLENYIDSWIEIIHNHPDSEVREKLWLYIEKRKYSGVQKLFKRYNRPIYLQPVDNEPPSPQSNIVVTNRLTKWEPSSGIKDRAD